MKVNCDHCGAQIEKSPGHVNRARKLGMKLFCNRVCFGLDRRSDVTEEEKKERKRLYDIEYRSKNKEIIREKKKVYEQSPAGRAMQKRNREKFKQTHLEYCRTPEYRAWKKIYDRIYRAKKDYGEFYEAALLLRQIEDEVDNREVMKQNQLINKSQKRRRSYEKFKREELETNTLGNPK